jgi:hypothetical protein
MFLFLAILTTFIDSSGMTEKASQDRDMFFRQGILGPGKVPFIMAGSGRSDVVITLGEVADADFMKVGSMRYGVPEAQEEKDLQSIPWAMRGLNCGSELSQHCNDNLRYMGQCWIERDDFTPPTNQGGVGGRAKVRYDVDNELKFDLCEKANVGL